MSVRPTPLALAACAAALLAAACGGDDPTAAPPSPADLALTPEADVFDAATRAALAAPAATTLYVAPTGSDANDGRTAATAVRTIQRALDLAGPGDVVGVAAGEYAQPDSNQDVATVRRGGTADRWLRLRAEPGQAVTIRSRNWQAIKVTVPYVVVEGFRVVGALQELAADPARVARGSLGDPVLNGSGIAVAGPNGDPGAPIHHVVVRGNTVEEVPGGAIYTYGADRLTVEDNVVRDCAWFSPYGNSGISLYQNRAADQRPGVHLVVRRNRVSGCENRVASVPAGVITDGNAIIIDDARNTQNNSTAGPFPFRTRVENNVVFDNGGRGIHVYLSDHVDVVNNTTYRNSRSPAIREGELSGVGNDLRWVNNLAVATPGRPAGTVDPGTGILFQANLLTGGPPPAGATAPDNLLGVDPRLTAPDRGDFTLQADSPARGRGTRTLAPAADILGRPRGTAPDIGAYQHAP